MKPENLPPNSMAIVMSVVEDGDMDVHLIHSFAEDYDEDAANYYLDILNGLNLALENSFEFLILAGAMARMIKASQEEEISFEPDDELLKAMAERKVIPLNRKKLN